MRTPAGLAVLAVATLVAGCARAPSRDLARYYDPQGLFAADLPAANRLTVTPAQQGQDAASVLSGVVATPPQPSPTASGQLGGGIASFAQQAQAGDQTLYEVLVVTTDGFESLEAMVLYFLTADPSIDVREERAAQVGPTAGSLVVADVLRSGSALASMAAAFTLGTGGVGFIVAAIFPAGRWQAERPDFTKVLDSFTPEVPSGLRSFPLSAG